MAYLQDIDIYGRQSSNGALLEFFDEDAIKNALTLFLTAKRGEFLLNPTAGGYVDLAVFKNMSEEALELVRFEIKTAMTNNFAPFLQIKNIDIVPDYTTRTTEIKISYYNPVSKSEDEVVLFTNVIKSITVQQNQDIPYKEENLKMFCIVQKPDQYNNVLSYDSTLLVWKWGKFLFTEFDPDTDPFAAEIFEICNG